MSHGSNWMILKSEDTNGSWYDIGDEKAIKRMG